MKKINKERLLLCILFFVIATSAKSQEQLKHTMKFYVDTNRRVYWNLKLPVYVFVSKSASDASEKHLMKSETSPQYTNPMYFSHEGKNYLFSPSAVDTVTKKVIKPLQDVRFQVYVDGTPPRSRLRNNLTPYKRQKKYYFGKGLELGIIAKDNMSGVDNIYYSVDNEDFKQYVAPITFEFEKEYTIKYYSVDNVGNVEKINTDIIVIDESKPLTNLIVKGNHVGNIISGRAFIYLQPQDAFSGVAYTKFVLDNEKSKIYTKPISTAFLRQGKHVISYYSVDRVDNRGDSMVYEFYVDKKSPMIMVDFLGQEYYAGTKVFYSPRSKIKITALDDYAGVKSIYYSINNGKKVLYTGPFSLPHKQGAIDIKVYAEDSVGNKTAKSITELLNLRQGGLVLSLEKPVIKHSFIGSTYIFDDTLYISSDTKIKLNGYDKEPGFGYFTYIINNAEELRYEKPFTLDSSGFYTLSYTGFDKIGNEATNTLCLKVDNTPPNVDAVFSMPPIGYKNFDGEKVPVYHKNLKIFVAAVDNKVGVKKILYKLNSSVWKNYTNWISGFASRRLYKLKFRVTDMVGNETEIERKFYIK